MGGFLVMPAVGSCVPTATLPSGTAGPIAIEQPVGQGALARNRPDDVRTIQEALNQVTVKGEAGGPMPLLAVDGIKGPKTQAAIDAFQRAQVKTINGWFDDTFIRPFSAAQRLLNADSYASFAHECRTGSAAKPPFVRTAPGGLGGRR